MTPTADMTTVLEGEVIETPDTAIQVAELRALPVEAQSGAVSMMLSDVRSRLLAASVMCSFSDIRDVKAQAATLQEIVRQLRLGKEIQSDVAELMRRTERALGLAVRHGQERGDIVSSNEGGGPRGDYLRNGKICHVTHPVPQANRISPKQLFSHGTEAVHVYAMTDGVTDEMFEEVLAQARGEGNLSRINVTRRARAKAEAAAALAAAMAETAPEPPPCKTRKTAAARKVMQDLVISINSLAFIVADTDPAEVDFENHRGDIEDIRRGMARIKQFLNKVGEQN